MKQKSEAHLALIEKARAVGVILPEKTRSQKQLRERIEKQKRANARDEARAEISRKIMPI